MRRRSLARSRLVGMERGVGIARARGVGAWAWSLWLGIAWLGLVLSVPVAAARQQTLELGARGWEERGGERRGTDPVDPDDRAVLSAARERLAEDDPRRARSIIGAWLRENEFFDSPGLPEALLIRGDALVALGNEWKALYDYERILREFPGSDVFVTANEREYEIAERYLGGLRTRFLGLRIINASDIGIELLIRIQERMPGSALAERAAIRLADFYYDRRDIALASEMYEIYLRNFPNGPNRVKAEKRRIYTDLARFKGPRYDASSLIDARLNIEDFARRYPIEAQRTGLNDGLVARIDESQAAQMLDSAEWYLQTKNFPAARLTMRRLIIAHPMTFAAERAREFLRERGWDEPVVGVSGGAGDAVGAESGPGAGPEAEDGPRIVGPQPAEVVPAEPSENGGRR